MISIPHNSYFVLVSNCIPVKGFSRSVIYDLDRKTFDFIPNELYALLIKHNKKEVREILNAYSFEDRSTVLEYLVFLIENEYVLLCNSIEEVQFFPDMNLSYDSCCEVSNGIIDFKGVDIDFGHYRKCINDLEDLGCYHLQLRFFPGFDRDLAHSILNELKDSNFIVEVLIAHENSVDVDYYFYMYKTNAKIVHITVLGFDNAENLVLPEKYEPFSIYVEFTSEVVSDQSHCGNISPSYFAVNIEAFTEATNYNSCLNKKVGIDYNGNIKNCPTLSAEYGNIINGNLKEIVKIGAIKQLWTVQKDQIATCSYCEFRYMCTDCRAHLPGLYEKPANCKYDPITCEWS